MGSAVDHPAHYGGEDDPYEVIKVAEAWGFDGDAYLFNVLKYIRRNKDNELEDLKKARFYLDRKIRRMEENHAAHEAALAPRYTHTLMIHTGENEDAGSPAFNARTIEAHRDWTVGTLASVTATCAKMPEGSYGIAIRRDGKAVHSAISNMSFMQDQNVGWMLKNWPPYTYTYHLKRTA